MAYDQDEQPIDPKATGTLNESGTEALRAQIEDEIRSYTTEVVNVGEAYDYSQYKLVRRITLFESHTYPTGKFDSQGNYKLWYDGISSRIMNEVKNIDFDTKDIKVYSDRQKDPNKDDLAVLIVNLKMVEYLRETGQADELNEAIEEGSGWGNVVWKKMKKGYQRVDLKNFYVINQTAFDLDDSPVIERHTLTASDLRGKIGSWQNVEEVLENCKSEQFKQQIQSTAKATTVPYYDIYERNGDICLADLKRAKGVEAEGISEEDEETYVFAKTIGAGKLVSGNAVAIEYLVYAEEMKGGNCDLYKEFHRGPYKGKWFREGLYELLFDQQVRLNMIGNQLALGLEFASKVIFRAKDKLVIQNVLTDMKNGDVIRSADLEQVPVAMEGFSQLVEEWNLVQQHMNDLANSSPIVTGEGLPQRMPFQVAALLNQNANKLFDYIRQKLAIPVSAMFEEWIVYDLVKDITAQEVLRLTGDPKILDRIYAMVAEDWYVSNLIALGPHGQDVAEFVKANQIEMLKKRPQFLMTQLKAVFKGFQPRVSCVITGENSTLPQDMATLSTFIGLETDPIRRTALIEMAMAKKGIDVSSLPKSDPRQMQPDQPAQGQDTPPKQATPMRSPMQPGRLSLGGAPALPARPNPPARGNAA